MAYNPDYMIALDGAVGSLKGPRPMWTYYSDEDTVFLPAEAASGSLNTWEEFARPAAANRKGGASTVITFGSILEDGYFDEKQNELQPGDRILFDVIDPSQADGTQLTQSEVFNSKGVNKLTRKRIQGELVVMRVFKRDGDEADAISGDAITADTTKVTVRLVGSSGTSAGWEAEGMNKVGDSYHHLTRYTAIWANDQA